MNLFEEQLQLEKQSRRLGGEIQENRSWCNQGQRMDATSLSRSIVREAVGLVSDELTKLIKSKYGFSKGMRNVGVSLMGSIGIDPREASYIALAIVMDSIVLKNSHSDTCFKIGKAIEDQARFLVFKKSLPSLVQQNQNPPTAIPKASLENSGCSTQPSKEKSRNNLGPLGCKGTNEGRCCLG